MVDVNSHISNATESADNLIPRPTWVFGITALGIEVRSREQATEMAWLAAIVDQESGQVFAAYVSPGLPEALDLAEALCPQLAVHLTSVLRPLVLRVDTAEVALPDSIRRMLAQHDVPIDDQLIFLPGTEPIEMIAELVRKDVLGQQLGCGGSAQESPVCAHALTVMPQLDLDLWHSGSYDTPIPRRQP